MSRQQTAVVALGVIVAALSLAVRGTAQDAAAAKSEAPTLISKAAHVDIDTMIAVVALILSAAGMFWRHERRLSLLEAAKEAERRECELKHAAEQQQFAAMHDLFVEIKASISDLSRAVIEGRR